MKVIVIVIGIFIFTIWITSKGIDLLINVLNRMIENSYSLSSNKKLKGIYSKIIEGLTTSGMLIGIILGFVFSVSFFKFI